MLGNSYLCYSGLLTQTENLHVMDKMMINKKISTNSELKTVMFHRPCSISNGLKMSLISKNKDSGTMLIFPRTILLKAKIN